MATKIIVNCETGQTEEVELTADEIAQAEADAAAFAERQVAFEAEVAAKQAARESAIAKLSTLGLTEEEAAAIVGI
jgi:uncharacterized protein (AIM24 family)